MRVPARYAPLLFGALLSAIMVVIVSGVVLAINRGIHDGFAWQWITSGATTWLVAFPTVTVVAPRVRALVGRLTAQG